jgi:hypothetical protein
VRNHKSYLSGTGCIRSTGGIVIPRTLLRRTGTLNSLSYQGLLCYMAVIHLSYQCPCYGRWKPQIVTSQLLLQRIRIMTLCYHTVYKIIRKTDRTLHNYHHLLGIYSIFLRSETHHRDFHL